MVCPRIDTPGITAAAICKSFSLTSLRICSGMPGGTPGGTSPKPSCASLDFNAAEISAIASAVLFIEFAEIGGIGVGVGIGGVEVGCDVGA